MDLAAKLEHRACVAQKTLGRAQSERTNDFGAKGLDLPEQERRASARFVRLRGPVLRRAALYDIADIDFLALETDCEDHFIEQLSCAADKRASLLVFFGPRTLTDEDQAAFGRTFPEYQVSTA
jgi:hypothetical protein